MFERTVDYEFAGRLPRKFYMPLRHSERSEESIMVEYAVSALCFLYSARDSSLRFRFERE